jgi:hypothetical protein
MGIQRPNKYYTVLLLCPSVAAITTDKVYVNGTNAGTQGTDKKLFLARKCNIDIFSSNFLLLI